MEEKELIHKSLFKYIYEEDPYLMDLLIDTGLISEKNGRICIKKENNEKKIKKMQKYVRIIETWMEL